VIGWYGWYPAHERINEVLYRNGPPNSTGRARQLWQRTIGNGSGSYRWPREISGVGCLLLEMRFDLPGSLALSGGHFDPDQGRLRQSLVTPVTGLIDESTIQDSIDTSEGTMFAPGRMS